MKIKICFLTGVLFTLTVRAVEISSDSFVKPESEEEETSLELSAPNMERAIIKESAMIKRDLTALDSAVSSAKKDQSGQALKNQENLLEKSGNRKPASQHPLSVDFGDSEIRWNP